MVDHPDSGPAIEYSVVIPCLNGEATIERQLLALVGQETSLAFEVIVADNGSTDSTAEIVNRVSSQHSRVRLVDASERRGINHARNRGVQESKGEFLLFCDADDEVEPAWLTEMDQAVKSGAHAVGGTLDRRLPGGERVSLERRLYFMFWDIPWPAGANCGISRRVYEEIGPFDENLMGGADETDFFWRAHFAGYETVLVEKAIVRYFLRDNLRQVFRQAVNYGKSHVRLYAKYKSSGMPRSNPLRSVAVILHSALSLVMARKDSLARRKAVERLGAHVGRVRGSLRERVMFL